MKKKKMTSNEEMMGEKKAAKGAERIKKESSLHLIWGMFKDADALQKVLVILVLVWVVVWVLSLIFKWDFVDKITDHTGGLDLCISVFTLAFAFYSMTKTQRLINIENNKRIIAEQAGINATGAAALIIECKANIEKLVEAYIQGQQHLREVIWDSDGEAFRMVSISDLPQTDEFNFGNGIILSCKPYEDGKYHRIITVAIPEYPGNTDASADFLSSVVAALEWVKIHVAVSEFHVFYAGSVTLALLPGFIFKNQRKMKIYHYNEGTYYQVASAYTTITPVAFQGNGPQSIQRPQAPQIPATYNDDDKKE